ncbi:hypothetical protein ACF061_00595 [Streptomyces sp. NPDC015220]|uniref:hypothetical protein n=1 Tax=Streptomyces sp. NPDC015220 TaxID=3364947 RepID=UPI0036FECDA9
MPAISVGSVEVDVVPNAQGVRQRLQNQLVPAANEVGDEVGRIIGRYLTSHVASSIRDGLQRGARTAQPAAVRGGEETGGAFARSLKARLEAAFRSLPKADIRLSDTGVDADLARLRARMETLSNKRIGVDIDAARALAEVTDIEARLKRLGAEHPNVQVRVDTAAALAQLAAVRAVVDAVDGKSIDISTQQAVGGFSALTTAALAFGPAIIPALPVVAAGLGAIAAAATAAAAGIGGIALVAVPAFKQIGTVLQAQKAAQDAATTSTLRGGQASSQSAQRALQQASAAQSLATAQRNAARQISDAERGVTDAERQAAQANAQAAQQVKQAKQSLADAYQQAADRMEQATRQVTSAERDLAAAQKTAQQAQVDLTQARKDAAQQLEDLNNRLTDSQLSQRDAEIALEEATKQRDAVLKNANATELDKQKALLAYDQAVQRLKEQTTETTRLKDETDAANKAGVDGSKTVKDAQDRVSQAQQDVTDKTQALKDAQAAAAKTQIQNTRAIADAQQKLSAAQANVAETQRAGAEAVAVAQERLATAQQSAADSIASAQRQIASASLSAAGGVDQAAIAQAKYQEALAKLTPSARGTLNAFVSLKDAFSAWSRSLQPAVMPIFTRALDGMRRALPGLTPLVLAAASAVKGLQDRFAQQIKSPFWQGFRRDLQAGVVPAITGLGVAFGNVMTGMAGIINAFLPHMDGISTRMQTITQRFATWGKNLKGSPEFEHFLSYASQQAPILGQMFGQLFGAVFKLGLALAPMAGTATSFITAIAGVINALPVGVLTTVGVAFASIAIGSKLAALALGAWRIAVQLAAVVTNIFTGEQWALNTAMEANPIGFIVTAIMALVVAVIYAYQHFDWFRTAVQVAWSGIKTAAVAVYNWFKGPFVDFFAKTLPGAVSDAWGKIKAWVIYPIGDFFTKTIPGWGDTLRRRIVDAFDTARSGVSTAWSNIKTWVIYPIRDFFTKTIPGWGTTLADKIVGAFDNARAGIKTAWDKIKDIAKAPVKFIVDTVYNEGIRKVWNLVTDAFGGKHLDPMTFATGGILPGYTPGRDVHLAALSGGEAIMRPEWTRAVGAGYVHSMNAAARAGGVTGVQRALGLPGFKDGGIFDGIGDVLSGAWDKVKKGASWLKDSFSGALKAGVTHVVNPLIEKIPGGSIGFVGLLKDLMKGAVARLVGAGTKGDEKASPNVDYKPGAGVAQWRPVVLQSLREVGQPSSLAGSTLRRMNQESGGNPTIVNKWDSNWQRGTPSVGLMQVIGPTFRSYAGKYLRRGPFSYGVSVDPLANVYSSMRYALGAYGSLSRAYDRPGGYDSGGWMPPGMNLMYNGLGQPEAVLTPGQWSAIHGAATRGGDGAQQPLIVELHAKEGALGDFIDVRVQNHQQKLIQVINAS